MSNGNIEKTMKRAQRRTQLQRMGQTLMDPWAWVFAVLVAADVSARMLLVMFAIYVMAIIGLTPTWWVLVPLFVWMVAPIGYIFQHANDRKRLIRLEALLDGEGSE